MLRQVGVRTYAEYFCPINRTNRFETIYAPIEAPPHGLKPVLSGESASMLHPVFYGNPCEGDDGYLCLCLREGSPAEKDRKELLEHYADVRGTITQKYSYTPWSHVSFEEKFFKVLFSIGVCFHFDYTHPLQAMVAGSDGIAEEPRTLVEACDIILMSRYVAEKKCKTRDSLEVRFHDTLTVKVVEDSYQEHTTHLHQSDNPYGMVLSVLKASSRG